MTTSPGGVRPSTDSTTSREALWCLALAAAFLLPLIVLGPTDDEEIQLGVFSSQLYYRDLVRGHLAFWLPNFGFGTPLPIGHRLDFHPVFFLAPFVPLRVTLSVLWLFQMGVMVFYLLRLAAATGIRQPMRAMVVAGCVFSVTSVSLFYASDWTTSQIGWTLLPAVVYHLRETVLSPAAEARPFRASARLGFVVGVWVLNGHPGYLAPLAIVLVAYTALAAPLRASTYARLAGAAVGATAMFAERLFFTVDEMRLFPEGLPRTVQAGFGFLDYLGAGAMPFVAGDPTHAPFIGAVVGSAAVMAVWHPAARRDPHLRGCVGAFCAAVLFSLVPADVWWSGLSGGWLFREPMVLFGLLAGGRVLSDFVATRPPGWAGGRVLIAVQLAQQTFAVAPVLHDYWGHTGRLLFYRYQGTAVGLGATLVDDARQYGPRIYLSPRAQELTRSALSPYGIHVLTDLVGLGLSPVNGWFKGISMDRVHPSWARMQGQIAGQLDVIRNQELLDVAGVNLVLTTTAEGPASPGLIQLSRLPVHTFEGDDELLVLANPGAWPGAVLMDPGVSGERLALRPSCEHQRAMCRDFTPFAAHRLDEPVRIDTLGPARRSFRFAAADRERVLYVSSTYRQEWRGESSDGPLRVEPIADAFVAVVVPRGVREVQLEFRPRARTWLAWASATATVVLGVCFVAGSSPVRTWRRRRQAA